MVDYEMVLEMLREAVEMEDWDKIEEVIQIIRNDIDDPFDEYRKDEDLEDEDNIW